MSNQSGQVMRELASLVAMYDAANTPALEAHQILSVQIWRTLRALGFDHGHVLVHGDDPATFLGQPHTTGTGLGTLVADITHTHRPGRSIATSTRVSRDEQFDVVIGALPFNDVRLASPQHQVRRRLIHDALSLASLANTRPGGLTVLLAAHDMLDTPYNGARHEMARIADLVGAVRLPGGIQRNMPGVDHPADLLILRRNDHTPARGIDFTATAHINLDGQHLTLNRYYDQHPDNVLGQLGTEPLGDRTALTVTGDRHYFAVDLETSLEQITTEAVHDAVAFDAARARRQGIPSDRWHQQSSHPAAHRDDPSDGPSMLGLP